MIKVKAENGTIRTYTINVNRKDGRSNNNYLKTLNVINENIPFNKDTLVYNMSVAYEVTRLEIEAVVEKFKQAVTGIKNCEFEPSYKETACKYCLYKDFCGLNKI